MSKLRYTPDITIAELQAGRDRDADSAELAAIMRRASDNAAKDQWPDPRQREQAGLGCVVAAATLSNYSVPGVAATLISAFGLFGLGLVESARAELDGTNPARGQWTAFAVDGTGEILVDVPLEFEHLESVVVVRGSAMPVELDGILCLPETGQRTDVLYEIEDLGDDPDGAPIAWEQAQAVAAALNATMAGWSVPRIEHNEDEPVGPTIHGALIHRSAGASDVDHTRTYAAQLLAAADELDRRDAKAVAAR